MPKSKWTVDMVAYRNQNYDNPEVYSIDVDLFYRDGDAPETVLSNLKEQALYAWELRNHPRDGVPGVQLEWDVLDVIEWTTDEIDSESGTDGPPAP